MDYFLLQKAPNTKTMFSQIFGYYSLIKNNIEVKSQCFEECSAKISDMGQKG